jgi:hypothetical protein
MRPADTGVRRQTFFESRLFAPKEFSFGERLLHRLERYKINHVWLP